MNITHHVKIYTLSLSLTLPSGVMAYSYGNPTAAEQAHLEAINQARANPQAEAARLGIDLFEGVDAGEIDGNPQPPLTLNTKLSRIARTHSKDMADRDYFAHNTPEGIDPFERMTEVGYEYKAAGENIANLFNTREIEAVGSSLQMHDSLFIDEGVAGRGHRVNILSPKFKEIGIGLADGQKVEGEFLYNTFYITTDFGTDKKDERSFVLGVVYDDQDGDDFYTAGEGLADVTVTVVETGEQTTTANAGGYALPLADGQYTLNFTHPTQGEISHTITIAGNNVKVDVLTTDFQQATDDNGSAFPALSNIATNNSGQKVNTATAVFGGISVNDNTYQQQVVQKLSDKVDVRGQIIVDPAHVGQQADIFVYAKSTLPPDEKLYYFMLGKDLSIIEWDQQPKNLIAFTDNVTLTDMQEISMYSGQFIYPGTLNVHFGYRLQDGTVVFNFYPIDITIND